MKKIKDMDWGVIYDSLGTKGYAHVRDVLSREECEHASGFYNDSNLFRTTINMQRYRFGKGEYKYFRYPLPPFIQVLREEFYRPLAKIANEWMAQLSLDTSFPDNHREMLDVCKSKKQERPTPLVLRYEAGGYNSLHQDLYGEVYFPFQVVIVLTQDGRDHAGGDLVLTEQVPRAQSKAQVIRPDQGDAIIFTTNFRPVKGTRGFYRARVKHGVSEVKSGVRYALGIIFHDAA